MFSRFMIKGLSLVLVTLFLVGCVGSGNDGTISLTGIVTSGDEGIPVKDAEVRLARQGNTVTGLATSGETDFIATTSSDGRYRFDGINPGTYEMDVLKDGYNPIKITRTLNGSSNIPINIRSFLEVLQFSNSDRFDNFQLAAYVYPYDASIEKAEIISPSGYSRELESNVHFGAERFSSWWNDAIVENGLWQVHVYYSNLGKTTHSFVIDSTNIPGRPELVFPIGWEDVDTVSPEMEFTIPSMVHNVTIRLYEVINRDAYFFDDRIDRTSLRIINVNDATGNFVIPHGVLQEGKEYGWQVYVTLRVDAPLTYTALSDMHYFSVSGERAELP